MKQKLSLIVILSVLPLTFSACAKNNVLPISPSDQQNIQKLPSVQQAPITTDVIPTPVTSSEGDVLLKASSRDKQSGVVYSTATLTVPTGALETTSQIKIVAFPALKFDKFIGGSYIIAPQETVLTKEATLSITFTDDAIPPYKAGYQTFSQDNFELALNYFDDKKMTYIPLPSVYNRSTKTVTAKISKFYKAGFMIVPLAAK